LDTPSYVFLDVILPVCMKIVLLTRINISLFTFPFLNLSPYVG